MTEHLIVSVFGVGGIGLIVLPTYLILKLREMRRGE